MDSSRDFQDLTRERVPFVSANYLHVPVEREKFSIATTRV